MMNVKFAPSSFTQLLRPPFLNTTSRSAHIPPIRSIPPVQGNSRDVGSAADRGPERERVHEQRPATSWDTATSTSQAVSSNRMICLIIIIYKEGYRLFSYQKWKERKTKTSLAKFLSWQRAGKERRLPNSVAEHALQAEMNPPTPFPHPGFSSHPVWIYIPVCCQDSDRC